MAARPALALAVLAALALSPRPARPEALPRVEWKQVVSRPDLQVYEGWVPQSRIYALRADGVLDQPLDRVAWALLDPARSQEWVKRLREDRVVRWQGPRDYVEYNLVDMPSIVRDRETVALVHLEPSADGRSLTVTSHSVDDPGVPPSRRVRAQINHRLIRLTALPGGKRTRLEVEVHVDPRGSIPSWLINDYQRRWPAQTFDALRRQAAKPDLKPPAGMERALASLKP